MYVMYNDCNQSIMKALSSSVLAVKHTIFTFLPRNARTRTIQKDAVEAVKPGFHLWFFRITVSKCLAD